MTSLETILAAAENLGFAYPSQPSHSFTTYTPTPETDLLTLLQKLDTLQREMHSVQKDLTVFSDEASLTANPHVGDLDTLGQIDEHMKLLVAEFGSLRDRIREGDQASKQGDRNWVNLDRRVHGTFEELTKTIQTSLATLPRLKKCVEWVGQDGLRKGQERELNPSMLELKKCVGLINEIANGVATLRHTHEKYTE